MNGFGGEIAPDYRIKSNPWDYRQITIHLTPIRPDPNDPEDRKWTDGELLEEAGRIVETINEGEVLFAGSIQFNNAS